MDVVIVGSGSAAPDGARASPGIYVELRGGGILLDCGSGVLHGLARFGCDWESVTHVVLTHYHVDHVLDLPALLFALKWECKQPRTRPLTVVGPTGLLRFINGIRCAFGPELLEPGFPVHLRTVVDGQSIGIDPEGELTFGLAQHLGESVLVKVTTPDGVIGYTGNTELTDAACEFFAGTDTLISECSLREAAAGTGHLDVRSAAELAARAAVKRLLLMHAYFDIERMRDDVLADVCSAYGGECDIAYDGYRLKSQ